MPEEGDIVYNVELDPTMLNREQLIERLLALDWELSSALGDDFLNERITLVIVGSSCLILRKIARERTNDVDILDISHTVPEEILEKYDMNTKVQNVAQCFPWSYEERLEKLEMQTEVCDFYMLSLEDIVAAKIAAYRGKDKRDLYSEEVITRLNFEQLKKCASEVQRTLTSDRASREFTQLYNRYIGECGEVLHQDLSQYELEFLVVNYFTPSNFFG